MPIVQTTAGNLNYTTTGSGPPILFLAGKGLDSFIYDELVDALQGDYTCIRLDNLGSGESDAPRGPYTIDAMANATAAVLAHLGLSRVHVVGHSMGGYIAMQLAHDHPALVSRLVLLATSACGASDCLGTTPRAAAAISQKTGSPLELFRRNLTVFMGPRYLDDHPEAFDAFVEQRARHRASGRGFAAQHKATLEFDMRDSLYRIQCPALVIHGTDDQLISLTRAMEMTRELDDAKLVPIKHVGHFPMIEAPRDVERELRAFFSTRS